MITTTYAFTCPCCDISHLGNDETVIQTFSATHNSTGKSQGRELFTICYDCWMQTLRSGDTGWLSGKLKGKPDWSPKVITRTTIKCDCFGCNNTLRYTDEPIACGFPPSYFWSTVNVLLEHEEGVSPGLHRKAIKHLCPECIKKALAGDESKT